MINPVALDELRAALAPGGFSEDPAVLQPRLIDHRQRYHGASPFLAQPATREQVAAMVAVCAAHRIGIVPQGGNTSYCGGATPDASGRQVLLSLHRLRRIRAVDASGFNLTVEAGCTLLEAQAAATAAERLFPLSLGSEGTCQIGGNIATNAGGTAVLRYGVMRDLVLGLEVVLPDGRILDQLGSLRKDNTGYDVKQWFIGAEGTLGIVTAACLKLFPRPFAHATGLLAVNDLDAAVALLSGLRARLGDSLVAFEVMPRAAIELLLRHIPASRDPLGSAHPWYVLTEAALQSAPDAGAQEFTQAVTDLIGTGLVRDAVLAGSQSQRQALWHLRESVPAAQTREGASIKHDVSLPIAAIPAFVRSTGDAVAAAVPGIRLIAYGHLGDGNLHFNFSPPVGEAAAAFSARTAAVTRLVHDQVAAFGGSFSAEHGIGQSKVGDLRRYENPVALDLMRTLKRALDPHNIMNPGKVL